MIPNNLIITRLMKIYSKKIYDNKKAVVYWQYAIYEWKCWPKDVKNISQDFQNK